LYEYTLSNTNIRIHNRKIVHPLWYICHKLVFKNVSTQLLVHYTIYNAFWFARVAYLNLKDVLHRVPINPKISNMRQCDCGLWATFIVLKTFISEYYFFLPSSQPPLTYKCQHFIIKKHGHSTLDTVCSYTIRRNIITIRINKSFPRKLQYLLKKKLQTQIWL